MFFAGLDNLLGSRGYLPFLQFRWHSMGACYPILWIVVYADGVICCCGDATAFRRSVLGDSGIEGVLARYVWNRDKSFFDIKNWVASALVLEACYYALLLPSGILMIGFGRSGSLAGVLLGIDYLLMVLFTVPFLVVLAVKAYRSRSDGFRAWRWTAVTLVGYIAALWANSIFKWLDRIIADGFAFFSVGINALGALNSLVLMSLALVFTVIGAFSLAKQDLASSFKWLGLAFVFVGLHFLVYVVYSYLVGMLAFLVIAEIWAIPLLGLGLTMLRTKIGKMEQ